ncbi:Membrane-associated protease RseP, regulator of RpoE activity [Agreia pratensis]|uniref:Membrane-associated protease RseP, regulator of RpoE activity n=1 Tax=Agreia pratensis TaxID=150121 RepID=A0A1X7K6E1_9MICO|nr:Membrane-associated protease RseP, regulator of RpoE activity [Agreia pratensis]
MHVETVLQFILGVLIIFVGLIVSIGLHEVGHLVPAKLFGVKVTQYMIGFGPTLFSRKRGETEYGFKAIPGGGYISMIGMFPPAKTGGAVRNASTGFFNTLVQDARDVSAETIGDDDDRAFYRLPVWKRIIIMAGGPAMNFVIAIVVFAIVLCGFGVAKTSVGSISQCVLPATSERQTCDPGDTPGPGVTAGFKEGDIITAIDGKTVANWSESTAIIQKSPNKTLSVEVQRDGQTKTLTVVPFLAERYELDSTGNKVLDDSGQPVTQEVGFVGIGPKQELVPQGPGSVLPFVGENIASVAHIILNLPQRMVDVANAAFGSGPRDPNGPISVVGVGRAAGEIASMDEFTVQSKVATLLGLIGSLNIALGVINLVPLMPLDGGHIAGALWEGIRRFFAKLFKRRDPGPVDTAKLMPLTFAVVIVIGAMSVLLTYADIVKPINLFG